MSIVEQSSTSPSLAAHAVPDFIIIGAMKAATTSLYAYLKRHPQVFMTGLKEPNFFARPEMFSQGMQWYQGLFAEAPKNTLRGEASTWYTRWPHTLDTPQLISEHLPTRKFIYILRHPAERAFSHYLYYMRDGVTMSFDEALASSEIYFDFGNYMAQLERYWRFFDKESIHVMFSEDLKANPDETLAAVQKFLGLDVRSLTHGGPVEENLNRDDHYLRNMTTQRLRKIPGISAIADRIPKQWRDGFVHLLKASILGRKIESTYKELKLSKETRQRLIERYRPSIEKLEEYTQRDLSHWLV